MDIFREMLLKVWTEACRHIEIEHSLANIARILLDRMPLDRLTLLSYDQDRALVSVSADGLDTPVDFTPRQLSSESADRLLQWAAARQVTAQGALALDEPLLTESQWLIGPLWHGDNLVGLLAFHASSVQPFTEAHQQMSQALLDPLAAALENDRRLHELKALREAAEADKRSALARLGRAELIDTIIGAEAGLRPVMQRVRLVLGPDIPVLLLGETGSGKEVIARYIHDHSPRAKGPFIRVNCGAIPPELIDSELFGHEKGSFTGAMAMRRGWFERADKGTLLLDEIGDLPLPAQVRLLRVIQEGVFERVGGERSIKVDVRLITATHRDLAAMVQNGRFRQDLWYRVAGFPIVLPPLRERRMDIPALAEHFAQKAARRFGLRYQSPTPGDLSLLSAYDWPGNIRELASVIDRAAILGDGQSLEIAKALGPVHASPVIPASTDVPSAMLITLDQVMKQHIESALAATNGRIEGPRGAAALLAINPHTLRARMRKLGISWQRFRSSGKQ
ncbi:MAG: sigma 54-interacting transcriptional regulator [Phycisphaeraceae bacterium]|nr:sigma 54-interacting transcriptional regulator [Phycisphaeraceae bacterium]